MYTINTIPHGKCFVRYLRTRCFCIRNLTRSLRSLVRFLIRQQLVHKCHTPALSMKYSLYTWRASRTSVMFYFVGVSSDLGRAFNSSNMKFDSPKRWKMLFLQTSNKERASLQSNSLKKKKKTTTIDSFKWLNVRLALILFRGNYLWLSQQTKNIHQVILTILISWLGFTVTSFCGQIVPNQVTSHFISHIVPQCGALSFGFLLP